MDILQTKTMDLESFLAIGDISLGKIREYTLVAVFTHFDPVKGKVEVISDRGVNHILTLLHSQLVAIADEESAREILFNADKAYPYGINAMNMSELDLLMQKTFVKLFQNKSRVYAECRTTIVPIGHYIPGMYYKVTTAATIQEALDALLLKDFILKNIPKELQG